MLTDQEQLTAEQAKIHYQELTQRRDVNWLDAFISSCWAERYHLLTGQHLVPPEVDTDPNI